MLAIRYWETGVISARFPAWRVFGLTRMIWSAAGKSLRKYWKIGCFWKWGTEKEYLGLKSGLIVGNLWSMSKNISWRKLVQKFRSLGFDGPYSGGRHQTCCLITLSAATCNFGCKKLRFRWNSSGYSFLNLHFFRSKLLRFATKSY